MRCAVVNSDGVIVNIIIADPSDPAPIDHFLVSIEDEVFCNIGWIWDGNAFVDPNPPQSPEALNG